MADIRFDQVKKVFDNGVTALESFSLHVPSPQLVVLVGPSGCGKTTLLRLIAGLERPTSGTIMLGDDRLDTQEPRKRDVAMVFQSYALYPHMTVRENLSFGLRIRKMPKRTIDTRVGEVAASLDIHELLDRRPAELSGGQRQRVALGRAIIREPKVFLFDEPLSNLDARLRDEMRYLIKRLYQRLKTTTVYVTHDQVEAMTIGELLVVLKEGRMHQVGTPAECYEKPADTFVASFLGSPPMNLLEGTFESDRSVRLEGGAQISIPAAVSEEIGRSGERGIVLGVRPEHFKPRREDDGNGAVFSGRVTLSEPLGHELLTHVDLGSKEIVLRGSETPACDEHGQTFLGVEPRAFHYFSKKTGKRIDAQTV